MSGDKLVFDLANEIEDVPNVFLRKDWVNILDNQNGNYNSNQSVIDTSQLSNSNKYMSYREGYLAVPLLLTLSTPANGMVPDLAAGANNARGSNSVDFAIGLKNWFGSIIHSLTLDFNGTTVIQQTPFINMWNSFKLMTSLSWQDVLDNGPTMGFYPDDALSWSYQDADSVSGKGVCNNTNMAPPFNLFGVRSGRAFDETFGGGAPVETEYSTFNSYKSGLGNEGFIRRQLYVNYDADATNGSLTYGATVLSGAESDKLWRSRIIRKTNGAAGPDVPAFFQVAIMSFIHLRHIHSFFNQIPLIKGAFMKLTLNLNNTTTQTTVAAGVYSATTVQNAVGGVNPIMLASRASIGIGGNCQIAANTGKAEILFQNGGVCLGNAVYVANLSVGQRCLNSSQPGFANLGTGFSSSIQLYVPAYSFNAVFEQAYISSPIKKVIYEDIYQYQVLGVTVGGTINSLLTNGIANLRSVLILPFYSSDDANHLVGAGIPVYQSPFDPAGTGPTSPLCLLTNFNIVVSGQNAIYNTERYSFEQFINQTYGANSVNAGMTDGLSSGLINQQSWEMEYCYHYVDVSRMLPVEQQVPKSVQVIGQNTSIQKIDLWCFLAYGCELSFDIVSGARV
jgi:hypothetical protein